MKFGKYLAVLCIHCVDITVAQTGKDGVQTLTAQGVILNKYYPVKLDIAAGSNTLQLAMPASSLCIGDLVMIYQAQGAQISTTNSAGYGAVTYYGSAGRYELKYVEQTSASN